METVLKLKAYELTADFMDAFKKFLGKSMDIDVIISFKKKVKNGFLKRESREEYFNRLQKAKEDVDKGNIITFSGEEFELLTKKLTGK